MARLLLEAKAVHRVAFYSHDTYGLGHLSRSLKLARSIAPELGGVEGVILTGSAWTELFVPPRGFRYVPLPSVVKCGAGYRPRAAGLSLDEVITQRQRRITAVVETVRPRLWVVDNVPSGLCGEVLPALRQMKKRPGSRCVLALRDVLDRPERVREEWARAGVQEALETLYDEIWLFGDRQDVRRLTCEGLLAAVAHKVIPCGRLGIPDNGEGPRWRPPGSEGFAVMAGGRLLTKWSPRPRPWPASPLPRVLVTGGGGGDAAHLVTTYLEALRTLTPAVASRIVLGPDFPLAQRVDLAAESASRTSIERFVPDLPSVMAGADVVVAMAGYNTVCEIEACGRPAVLVPRVWPRQEQLLRARALELRGRARVLHPDRLTPASLWRAVEESLALPGWPPATLCGGEVAARRAASLVGFAAAGG